MITKIILTILAFIGLCTVALMFFGYQIVAGLQDWAGDPSEMTATLEEKVTFTYKTDINYQPCEFKSDLPDDIKDLPNYVGNYICAGNDCTFSASGDIDQSSGVLLIKGKLDDGRCGVVGIPANQFVKQTKYVGKLQMGKDYLEAQGINTENASLDDIMPEKRTKFGTIGMRSNFMGNYYADVNYPSPVTSDVITIADQKKTISYSQ